ncbi:MAG: ATPase [Gammaproteobacteria bacterium HGW-Gammaproteobacteria-1]|jgi:Ca2+-transporting ATPase|nr:MAG: ATPase [Gammaproteobacteria bacterium HGW-Gammaproteobacteria-1]
MTDAARPADTTPAWHTLAAAEVLTQLGVDAAQGLAAAEVDTRRAQYGPNALVEGRRRSLAAMFLGQFTDFMILVLLAAALVSGVVGEPQDTIAILVIVMLNAVIGAVQEYRAERAVAALRAMAAPEAQVLRDGSIGTVAAAALVPGDVVLLEAGNIVPADLRLLEAAELQVDESALTGESHGVEKDGAVLAETELPLGDRRNLAFRGSTVSRGRGRGVVVATGMNTEIGRIAELLHGEEGVRTPLQRRLSRFGRYLALAVLAICAVVFVSGLLQGQPVLLMFLTAVSLAVAAIPEALPAVVTVSLAFGARTLSRHNALVRRLPAVETLGSVTYICSDKTGTLTENRMTAERFVAGGEQHDALPQAAAGVWQMLGQALALNNDVTLQDGAAAGEPTELALYQAAAAAGYDKAALEQTLPRLAELPFDSERKMMSTLHRTENGVVAWVKGAPERVLEQCTAAVDGPFDRAALLAAAEALAEEGYRVLALARRDFAALPEPVAVEGVERELSLLGLVALIDPPRAEVPQAVADCLSAGITPVMITGDHPGTARAIARRLGIIADDARVLTGQALAQLSDAEFAQLAESVRVYARVSPEQKIRIVRALQDSGEFVAMTGDGVNDAPALKRADIGVAMGRKGTDVAREAAAMVLLDDNFATIVKAVREGRRIFDNIRKFIKDTMSSNSGEIWTLFLAPFLGLPVPLLPIHILWINLVTDGLPGLAFTAEPAERGVMGRPPRPPRESLFAHGMWQHIVWVGLFVGGISIASQAWALARGVEYWQTVVFTVLTVSQLFHSMAVRSERESLFAIGVTSNPYMLGAVLLTVALQLMVIYLPALNPIFHTQPLPLYDLGVCLALSSLTLVAVEIEKWLVRRGLIYQNG